MFELLLLIGFLYAGFFPPTPAPAKPEPPHQKEHYGRSWLKPKKLVKKNNNC
jgi:hypothetical protein